MAEVTFAVPGDPVPQGSMTCRCVKGTPIVKHSNERLAPWRTRVRAAAMRAMQQAGLPVFDGAVEVHLTFLMARGATVKRPFPTVPPDGDKLERAVLDAISTPPVPQSKTAKASRVPRLLGPVLVDDALVVDVIKRKRYAEPGDPPGVIVRVIALEDPHQQLRLPEGDHP